MQLTVSGTVFSCFQAKASYIAKNFLLSVIANVIMNSGEALVKAISDKSHIEFGYVKVGFDVFCVAWGSYSIVGIF